MVGLQPKCPVKPFEGPRTSYTDRRKRITSILSIIFTSLQESDTSMNPIVGLLMKKVID